MVTISDYLSAQKKDYQAFARDYIVQVQANYGSLNQPFAFMLSQLESVLLEGGKWHRPAVAELAYRISGGTNLDQVRPTFLALELMHRYLLIHDDIIDRDLVRHNQPTLEGLFSKRFSSTYKDKKDVIYSQGMAMVGGDVVNALVYDWLAGLKLPERTIILLVRAMSRMLLETAAGWQMQTEQNYLPILKVSEADYLAGLTLVSAQYSMVWPLRIGQLLADAASWNHYDQNLEAYGLHCGIAFQLSDDVLGMFGDHKRTGKPVGHDYREGKKTLLVLRAYEKADMQTKAWFDETLGNASDKMINRAQELIISLGALEDVSELITKEVELAKSALTKLTSDDKDGVRLLLELAELMRHRAV
jgi:geranylgeranyl pyrophosphate synthase